MYAVFHHAILKSIQCANITFHRKADTFICPSKVVEQIKSLRKYGDMSFPIKLNYSKQGPRFSPKSRFSTIKII